MVEARQAPCALSSPTLVALAAHQQAIADRINASGAAYLTPTVVKGVQILRVSIGAAATERPHVEALWDELRRVAAEVA